jgi:NAD(P)H-flavin reductase
MEQNIYKPIQCEVIDVFEESPTIKTIRLKPLEPFSFLAGQFISFTVPGIGEAPFTPSSSPFEKNYMEVTVMKTGKVTAAIHQIKKADIVGIRGPYGKPYPMEKFADKNILLVGGGVGLAPLRALFYALIETLDNYKSIVFCLGARSPVDFIFKKEVFETWLSESWLSSYKKISFRITADKKDETWKYNEGVVTKILDNLPFVPENAVVCGPPVMMKFTTLKLLDVGYKPEEIYLSMERKMYCAIGQCRHCLLGDKFVCKDGPVFTYEEIKNQPKIWA